MDRRNRSLGDLFLSGVDILKTTVSTATKKILAQIGSVVGSGQTDADNVEWIQHVGFASRPAKPVAGKQAAQGYGWRDGASDVIIASQDLRGLELYGALADGETCLYAVGEDGNAQGRVLLKKNGGIHIFTKKGNVAGGDGITLSVNSDGSITIASSEGNAILLGSDGSVKVFNASGGLQIKADGSIKLASGAKVEISGASITMGGPAALPVAIGPNVVTAISALQVQVAAQAAAWAALGALAGPILGAMLAPVAAPVAGATAAGAIAVSAASALIPAKRTSAD